MNATPESALPPAVEQVLVASGAPGRGRENVRRWLAAQPDVSAALAGLAAQPERARALALLGAESRLYTDVLSGAPGLLACLVDEDGPPPDATALAERFAAAAEPQALRRLLREELVATGYRDVVSGQPLAETLRQLSLLADAITGRALVLAEARLRERRADVPAGPLPFAVLALGKLGGEELNFSSDIDLLFCHDDAWSPAGLGRNQVAELFAQLGRELLRVLAGGEAGGRLYRVDIRLRPDGSRGAVSVGLEAAQRYYQTRGRTWERQMLLKARPMAGDLALGERLCRALDPFVHRGHLNIQAIADIKALKRQLEERARLRGDDIKEGPGGIRDIEFAVQFLQLLHGAELPEVRARATLDGLARLERAGCLDAADTGPAAHAYRFLRLVEHRLMTWEGRRTHKLPERPEALRALAGRLGFIGADAEERFRAELEAHRASAARLLEQSLHGMFREAIDDHTAARASELVLDPEPPTETVSEVLGAYGFADPRAAHKELERLSRDTSRFGFVSPRTRAFLASVAPRLLATVAATPEPDRTLSRLERTIATIGAKAVFYQLLHDERDALELFVRLASDSPYLNEQLRRSPGLTDELIDLLLTDARVTREDALARMRGAAGDPFEGIRSAHKTGLLLIGTRDLGGRANLATVLRELSELADAVMVRVVELVLAHEVERAGPLPEGAWLGVLGLGSFGGRALGYGSDLDFVACYGGPHGDRGLEMNERMERVGQRLRERISDLRLYQADMRLRPEGGAGRLVGSAGGLVRYYIDRRAQTWERIAATRMRAVAGDMEGARGVVERVHEAIYTSPPEDLAAATREMRQRLEEAASGPWDLKRAPGGMLDIDFAAAFLRLRHRGEPREVRAPGTIEALRALAAAGHLSPGAFTDLMTGYQMLRTTELRMRVAQGRSVRALPDDAAGRRRLSRSLGYTDTRRRRAEDAMCQELDHVRERVRRRFDEIIG